MMLDRFADIFGKGLAGAITGIDLTDLVKQGGLVGAATGKDMSQGVIPGLLNKDMSGGIAGLFGGDDYPSLANIQKNDGIFGKLPSLMGQGPFSHGFGDYDGDGFYKGDIGGGPITEAEKRKIVGGAYQLL